MVFSDRDLFRQYGTDYGMEYANKYGKFNTCVRVKRRLDVYVRRAPATLALNPIQLHIHFHIQF